VKENIPYKRNKLAKKELNSKPSDHVETDPHPYSRKS